MEEKIKISLPQDVALLLKKDCEDFKILKDNLEPNFNGFITQLIINYHKEFSVLEENLHDEIKKSIEIIPDRYKEKVLQDLISTLNKANFAKDKNVKTVTVSFKPTKNSEKVITFINDILLKGEAISSFYRRLLTSYHNKTKNEREKVIYKENYETLIRAIERQEKVFLQTKFKQEQNVFSVYALAPAREELFNYVLLYDSEQNKNVTIRLANIKSVTILSDKAEIPEINKKYFDRQIILGAQYTISEQDYQPILVKLDSFGKKLFNKIYLYRPTPIAITDDVYTFNCSLDQAFHYFKRFGANAIILSPQKLVTDVKKYYHFANKAYKNL